MVSSDDIERRARAGAMREYRVTGRAAILAAEMYLDGEVPAAVLLEAAEALEQLERERERTMPLPPDLAEALAADPRLADGWLEAEDLDLLLEEMVLDAEIDPDRVTTPAYVWAREQVRRGSIPWSAVRKATFARECELASEDRALVRRWLASRAGCVLA